MCDSTVWHWLQKYTARVISLWAAFGWPHESQGICGKRLLQKIDKVFKVVVYNIQHKLHPAILSGSQGVIVVSDFDVMEKLVDLAVPLRHLSDRTGKLGPAVLAYRVVLAFAVFD